MQMQVRQSKNELNQQSEYEYGRLVAKHNNTYDQQQREEQRILKERRRRRLTRRFSASNRTGTTKTSTYRTWPHRKRIT